MSDQEYIVFVDEDGQPTGETGEKLSSHHADTRLHLAFSCYIFSPTGKVLVTRRADGKRVWPTVWTNSVCGHPGPGESLEDAIIRRSAYEIGITPVDITVILPKYRYKTTPYNDIIENEFCPVFFAHFDGEPVLNPDEVSDYQWLSWEELIEQTAADTGDVWSWWCKDQITQLRSYANLSAWTSR